MRSLPYVVADVFTATPLEGNQLAVFTSPGDLAPADMLRLAREMNLAETVFVLPPIGGGDARVRIFTPTRELPFAGHPVLGTAFVLGEEHEGPVIVLETGIGIVRIELERDGAQVVFGRMAQVIPEAEPYERADELLAALGVERFGLPIEAYRNGPRHVFVELRSAADVAALAPDLQALASHEIGANCFAGSGLGWTLRMFAPAIGIPEDPATGSAAAPLAIHLVRHGRIGLGEEIEIHQGAEMGRPSVLFAHVEGVDGRLERAEVGGRAVIVARGEFRLP